MYNLYFGFSQSPFENNLDQRFLFLSGDQQEVLAALLYFAETKKGFAMVCGDAGIGKSMLINSFLDRLPESVKPIMILKPFENPLVILIHIAIALKIRITGNESELDLADKVKKTLISAKAKQKNYLLVIDEAHLLPDSALEEIRLLFNIETPDPQLLQILLVGQHELSHRLDRPEMRRLRQRLIIKRILSPLNPEETIQYIEHRLRKVGSSFAAVFEDQCRSWIFRLTEGYPRLIHQSCDNAIFRLTKGYPRLINQLCDNALLISMNEGQRKVKCKTLQKAMDVLQADRTFTPPSSLRKESSRFWKYFKIWAPLGAGLVLGLIGSIALIMQGKFHPISHIVQSISLALPGVKAPPNPTEIKGILTPSTEEAFTADDTKLPQTVLPKGAPPDREKEMVAMTLPAPEPKTIPAPAGGIAADAPEVKQEGKREGIPPGNALNNKEKEEPEAPESLSFQLKPEDAPPVTGPLPAPPAVEQLVTRGGESLTRIASQHYPKDPRLGIAALILQNHSVTKVDVIKSGELLYFPKINLKNRTIQLKDNLWYAFYGRYPSPERAQKIVFWFNTKKIKFIERDIKSGAGETIKRIFIGGYATEEELTQARNGLTTKNQ